MHFNLKPSLQSVGGVTSSFGDICLSIHPSVHTSVRNLPMLTGKWHPRENTSMLAMNISIRKEQWSCQGLQQCEAVARLSLHVSQLYGHFVLSQSQWSALNAVESINRQWLSSSLVEMLQIEAFTIESQVSAHGRSNINRDFSPHGRLPGI